MKKRVLLFLCLGMTLSIVGCGTANITPTSVSSQEASLIQISSENTAPTSSVLPSSDAQSSVVSEKEPASVPAKTSSKIVASTTAQKKPVTSKSTVPSKQEDLTVYKDVDDRMLFASEAALKNWLLSGTEYQDERSDALQILSTNHTITYYRPNDRHDIQFTLREVEFFSGVRTSVVYFYNLTASPVPNIPDDLQIVCVLEGPDVGWYEDAQKALQENTQGYYSINSNQIEYIYYINPQNNVCIYWKQNGHEHLAFLSNNHVDLIDLVIPLLNLQKVTYRTDVVDH